MFSLWRKARRENSAASRLLGTTSLRFALHGWQRKYEIPANIMLAVAEKEGGKPGQWVRNSNGTYDVGYMQFNTAYLKSLKKYGIEAKHVAAGGCYSYDLAAWRISAHLRDGQKGDMWTRVANYHSTTPKFNGRYKADLIRKAVNKRVFGLVIDFGTSQSPKSTRPLTTYWCPSRPGHQALRNNFASSLLLRTWLPMTGRRVRRPTLFSLWRKARRENSAASRLLGSTSLRFALHGWQRWGEWLKAHYHTVETAVETTVTPRMVYKPESGVYTPRRLIYGR
ncbi:hypothetical protein [Thiolapillus sp.]|uniref:hypothetical protein n=1 Tax=Thiolapillus sp. TaxID=2017437 RepID=UPI003AF4D3F3